jgi:hypothetical protein
VRLIFQFFSLLRNNSSLILVPASAFGVYLVIASRSHLAADDLYFFLSGIFALCTILDGGLPYKIATGAGGSFSLIFVLRRVQKNLLKVTPFLGLAIFILIWLSPFGKKNSFFIILTYSLLGLSAITLKVLVDAVRVVSLKSKNRIITDELTSAFGIGRFLLVLLLAGFIPYLIVFVLTLALELLCIFRINRIKVWTLLRSTCSIFQSKLRFDKSYVKANFAYNLAFNLDRIAAFYVLTPEYYRVLVGITSLYNMAILPHKIIENELLYPSGFAAVSRFGRIWLPAIFCGAGCTGLVIAVHLLAYKFRVDISGITYIAGVLWVAITAYYNRTWSSSLRNFDIKFLANVNFAAATASLLTVALGYSAYYYFVPLGLLLYSLVNFFGLFFDRALNKSDIGAYLKVAAIS